MTTSRLHLPAGATALALLTALIAAFTAPAHAAPAGKPKSCNIASVAHKLGATTVSSLKVTNVPCSTGIAVVKAFNACRTAHGKTGRCVKLVKGYACREQRTNAPTQINASVACATKTANVSFRYVQTL